MTVAAVVAAVLVVVVPSFLRQRRAKRDVDILALALKGFAIENGHYPTGSLAQVAALLRGENIDGQNPKRLDYVVATVTEMNSAGEFVDPWGMPYRILVDQGGRAYSCGPNRQDEKGEGDDVASWK